MTGEMTLSGRVLPVGGIKEKVLAAHRLGVKEVILPKRNEKAVKEDLPENVRNDIKIHLVSSIEEVLELALTPGRAVRGPREGPLAAPPVELTGRPATASCHPEPLVDARRARDRQAPKAIWYATRGPSPGSFASSEMGRLRRMPRFAVQ